MISGGERVYLWEGPPRLELLRRDGARPDGSPASSHALLTQDGVPGVVVVALRGDQVLLVEHERPWVGATLLELPRGFGEVADGAPGSDAACCAAATRELLEETGYAAVDPRVLGRYHPDSTLLPAPVAVVRVRVDVDAVAGPTDGEIVRPLWVPAEDLRGLVRDGRLRDGHTLAALAVLEASTGE